MRVTKDQLRGFGLLDSLPEQLRKLEPGFYFVFYYEVDEVNSRLKVFEHVVYREVNVSLYRGIQQKASKYGTVNISMGFFSDTFETRDGLFYQFLRTYNTPEDVRRLYDFAIEQDRAIQVDVDTNAITKIYGSDDFRRSMSFFCPSRLQSVMLVYDMVNEAFERRLSKPLYGESLKQVVSLIKYDGGVLPEMNGSLRFMVVGERAKLDDYQLKGLEDAKALVRSLQRLEDVYTHTGWAFSQYDGKWRTNIADNEASIDETLMYDVDGRRMYIPPGGDAQQVMALLKNPTRLYNINYAGRLMDVLKHPTLYRHYPDLAIMPVIYYFGDRRAEPQFFFSPNDRGGFIVIDGYKECGDPLSILLHEVQHAIQRKEGYASGGNQFLAQFVASLGGAKVRQIFSCINRIERFFRDRIGEEDRQELIVTIRGEMARNETSRQIKSSLIEALSAGGSLKDDAKNINFMMIMFLAENGDFSTSNLTSFLEQRFGDVVFDLFENITEAYQSAKHFKEKLASERYVTEDITQILFKSYENLYGEMESRSTQSSRCVESEFRNYFYLTKWENAPLQNIVVIDGSETVIDCESIKGAVETKDEEYVLHFEKHYTSEPYLHELGHIVYDALVRLGHGPEIDEEYERTYVFDNADEFFVNRFLGYIRERVDDEKIASDLKDPKIVENERISELLDDLFTDLKVDERLKFVQTILEA